jgi:signal transduction histidine kinase
LPSVEKKAGIFLRRFLLTGLLAFGLVSVHAQTGPATASPSQRVLMIFSEARDLPGNVMMEQAARAEMLRDSTNRLEFYTESLDAGHFPNPRHYRVFRDYLKNKYRGQDLDLVMVFMGRDFALTRELPADLFSNSPPVYVVVNELDTAELTNARPFTGIFQHFDVEGTVKFIFHLQPETRRVVVINGVSKADLKVAQHIAETARTMDGVEFEFWTNRPIADIYQAAAKLPSDTVLLIGTVQRDVTGETFYTSQILKTLAPSASVPVYVLAAGLVGNGALGGNVVDLEGVGSEAGRLAHRVLEGTPAETIPIEMRSNGVPMVDWRALERWNIKQSRLPAGSVIKYRPHSLWEDHHAFIIFVIAVLLAQAITILALLVQRALRHRAEAEIQKQQAELAHVSRVSTMGQLATALTHELNQPLGAILRNTEAAEIFLQSPNPNLDEIRAILADIRKDDQRAGDVIDRMRTLLKRRSLLSARLDLRELLDDTLALARVDAESRGVKLAVEVPAHLPPAFGDRVQLQQVLLNLILNGMDAMNQIPREQRQLAVRIGETDGNLHVSVSDRGAGIAPSDAEHIFEPFFTTKIEGMGMGLAISRTIIEAHGGKIWMDANAASGTTFHFSLPRMKAEPNGHPSAREK